MHFESLRSVLTGQTLLAHPIWQWLDRFQGTLVVRVAGFSGRGGRNKHLKHPEKSKQTVADSTPGSYPWPGLDLESYRKTPQIFSLSIVMKGNLLG
ncbi:hypothetical protein RRG08_029204 [Elysia crispata]|uniref:Uncharacterized protein n=1 Tax=Elysia crispata TaxID=231223 RepID=A0AAE1AJ39_9GAST|nr:hypothetical protein RRG08_029204 [Elysia crispata]